MHRKLIVQRVPGFVVAVALACVASGLATACSSSDKGESSSTASSSPLVGTWKQTKAEERVGTAPWAVAADSACRTDNTEEFAADGKWTLFDGTIQCGGGGTGIIQGAWRLAASDTKVIFTYDDAPGEYEKTIESLTATDLVVTYSTGSLEGTQVRSTYTKQ